MEINLTENSYIYNKALKLANKELQKSIKLLKDNEDKWNGILDLKLHDAACASIDFEHNDAFVSFSSKAQGNWFNDFCETTYENFTTDLKYMYDIDFESLRDDIRSTSSFYLGKLHDSNLATTLAEASELFNFGNIEILKEINDEFVVDVEESVGNFDDIEDFVNALLDLADNLYNEVEESLKPIITVYDYIESFKKEQVENFRDYVKEVWIDNV